MELKEIEEERERRNVDSAFMLKKALSRMNLREFSKGNLWKEK